LPKPEPGRRSTREEPDTSILVSQSATKAGGSHLTVNASVHEGCNRGMTYAGTLVGNEPRHLLNSLGTGGHLPMNGSAEAVVKKLWRRQYASEAIQEVLYLARTFSDAPDRVPGPPLDVLPCRPGSPKHGCIVP
jgi:hypothetical protein